MKSLDLRTKGAWGYRDNDIDLIHFIDDNSYPEIFGQKVLEMVAACKELETVIPEECAADFMADSVFCEYAYILNLDTEELEIYRGRNTNPHAAGRYAAKGRWSPPAPMTGISYYGVRLVKTIPFSLIRESRPEERSGLLWE